MEKYHNPIIKGFHPDPSICKHGNDYYLVTSSFEYLPGIPLFHSKNLINWQQIGHCLTNEHQIDIKDTPNSGGIFAPTIRYHQGKFYVITTNISKGNFIVVSEDLSIGFSKPIWIDINGIDPSLYFEGDKVYVQNACFNQNGSFIQQCQIDIKTGKIIEGPYPISYGCGGRDVEAPHIYYRNGYYYLICAEGGTREGHMITIQRSHFIYGPYEKCPFNPIVSNRDHPKHLLQSVGHGDLIEDNEGNWWLVALATRPYKHRHHLGRETILLPVTWHDGWPGVLDKDAKETYSIASTQPIKQPKFSFYDTFEDNQLRYEYNTIRNFLKNNYVIKNKQLILIANQETLDTKKTPVFLGVRQTEINCSYETKINKLADLDTNAGLAIIMDHLHHMEIGVTLQNQLYVKKRVGDLECINKSILIEDEIIIGIDASLEYYYFYYKQGKKKHIIDKTYVKHLCSETSFSPFCGVYGGMFIEGTGIAVFDYFAYQEK